MLSPIYARELCGIAQGSQSPGRKRKQYAPAGDPARSTETASQAARSRTVRYIPEFSGL